MGVNSNYWQENASGPGKRLVWAWKSQRVFVHVDVGFDVLLDAEVKCGGCVLVALEGEVGVVGTALISIR
jgi:hypothetical protein